MNILVVDDEEAIVEELGRFLERRGHGVVGAGGVGAALSALERQGPFDVVLTDLRMPAGSGLDVLRACRALPRPPLALVMSGHADGAEAVRAYDEGASHVFAKPVPLRALLQMLADIEISRYKQDAALPAGSPG
jgi:DNA-binding NtrC family response regulator